MRTALSSAAAPRASLDELLAGLVRHGLSDVELRVGDGHGIDEAQVDAAAAQLRKAGVRVRGLFDAGRTPPSATVPVVRALETCWMLSPALSLRDRLTRADWALAINMPVTVGVRGAKADREASEVRRAGHAVFWEAHPDDAPLDSLCDRVIAACGTALTHVRLCGGGPEGTLHEGRGIGGVMSRLVLARFDGVLTLAPSDAKYHVLWTTWLQRRGGWGCGTQAERTAERLRRFIPLLEEIS
ncbi:MAG: hypothetical protein H3C62_03700 [Gemmatimonadaceae bacterium]|nr:hypothetical protein [Gemmatimonadaceae bacterium]